MNFPALTMITFFHNHQMLQMIGRPQWKTPQKRSREYVDKLCERLQSAGGVGRWVRSLGGGWFTEGSGLCFAFLVALAQGCKQEHCVLDNTNSLHRRLGYLFVFLSPGVTQHTSSPVQSVKQCSDGSWTVQFGPNGEHEAGGFEEVCGVG